MFSHFAVDRKLDLVWWLFPARKGANRIYQTEELLFQTRESSGLPQDGAPIASSRKFMNNPD
jgi:hypothetical protein